MASGNPGDSAQASRLSVGIRGDGSVALPGGRVFRDQSKLIQFLRANPGYVYKFRNYIRAIDGGKLMSLAGYHLSSDGSRMSQFAGVPGDGTPIIRAWAPTAKEQAVLNKNINEPTNAKSAKASNNDPLKVDLTGPPVPAAPPGSTGPTMRGKAKPAPVRAQAQSTPAVVTTTDTTPAGPTPGQSLTAPLSKQAQQYLARLLNTKLPSGQKIDPNQIVKMLGPNLSPDLISSLAGEQDINNSINYLKSLVSQNAADAAQHQKNIDSWYTEVGNSLATAATRDKAINAATTASIQDASKGIISGIGGEANPGSGMAAQAGQQGVDLAAALGSANEQYNSDIAPLIQMEAAGAKSQAAESDRQASQDLQKQILDAQTTRDTNLANARVQLAQINSGLDQNRAQMYLGALQQNNALAQQGFANQQSKAQSILAALGFGLDVSQLGANVDINNARVNATNAATIQRGIAAQNAAAARAATARGKAMMAANKPMSQADLRAAEKQANSNLGALQQAGQIAGNVEGAIQAVKSAYNINAYSNRATRQAAYQSAVRHLPNVKVDPRWFGLGQ